MIVYVSFPIEKWEEIKDLPGETVLHEIELNECLGAKEWITKQVARRSGNREENVSPFFAFLNEDVYVGDDYEDMRRSQYICGVDVDETSLIYFDDHIRFLNNIDNNWSSYNSVSLAEDKLMKSASEDDCMKSYERMFELDIAREEGWCGKVAKMAFIPCLRRHMLRIGRI
jgi:hypothetical protein